MDHHHFIDINYDQHHDLHILKSFHIQLYVVLHAVKLTSEHWKSNNTEICCPLEYHCSNCTWSWIQSLMVCPPRSIDLLSVNKVSYTWYWNCYILLWPGNDNAAGTWPKAVSTSSSLLTTTTHATVWQLNISFSDNSIAPPSMHLATLETPPEGWKTHITWSLEEQSWKNYRKGGRVR